MNAIVSFTIVALMFFGIFWALRVAFLEAKKITIYYYNKIYSFYKRIDVKIDLKEET